MTLRRIRAVATDQVTPRLVAVGLLALGIILPSCDFWDEFMQGLEDCESYQYEHAVYFEQGGQLQPNVPDTANDYAMAMILNREALNYLFHQLAETELPTLEDSTDILGMDVSVRIQPQLPLFGISGVSCEECLTAEVEFHPEVGINGYWLPAGGGTIGIELPIGMRPISDQQTEFVAYFQDLVVDTLDLDLGDPTAEMIYDYIEPIVTALVTYWLQTEFRDAVIATFDSWAIGDGQVMLAPRGPYVYPQYETVVLPLQTNLILDMNTPLEHQLDMPEGSDLGLVFHPELLVAMAKRMNYENVIPEEYDNDGQATEGGGVKLTIDSMTSDEWGWLQTKGRLWFLEDYCGTVDMEISMAMQISESWFRFEVADFHFTEGQGVGLLLSETDWLSSAFINALLETLDITINYEDFLAGEAGTEPEMGPVEFNIDGRGITVFFNFVQGV
jgi:hypothetical protein